MQKKKDKNSEKKPIYKKWWFWVIIVVILVSVFGNMSSNEGKQSSSNGAIEAQEISPETFISAVEEILQGKIGEDESITSVTLKDGDLCVTVDLSKTNPEPLTIGDLAISRTGSITDAILTLTDYDSLWNTITIDFEDVGKITNSKDQIKVNEFGGRYFSSENFAL